MVGILSLGGRREVKPQLKLVAVKDIAANPPGRRRIDPVAVGRLADSIRVQGLLEPLLVRPLSGRYELVIGFRRLVAAAIAGMDEVPAVVMEMDEREAVLARLNHVLHGEPLGSADGAAEMVGAAERFGVSLNEIGIEAGLGSEWVKEKVELLKLPGEVQDLMREGRLSERHCRALLEIADPEVTSRVAAEFVAGDVGEAEAEEVVRQMRRGVPAASAQGGVRSSRRRMLRVVKDMRIFLNSFRSTVEALRQGGIGATMTESDRDGEIEIRVIIPGEACTRALSVKEASGD